MAVLFYFHRVCCPCKGINFHWPRSTSFHGTVNSLQDSLIISWKNIFYTLFMSCLWTVSQHGAHILLILLFRCVKCSEKMTCANCTTSSALFEEEWKTRNKYSFGVKSSRSGQSFLHGQPKPSLFTQTELCQHNGLRKWPFQISCWFARVFEYSRGVEWRSKQHAQHLFG